MSNYPVPGLTEKEQLVLTYIAFDIMEEGDYCVWAEDISKGTQLDLDTVVGVLGSLVKKGHVTTEGRKLDLGKIAHDVFLVIDGIVVCFADEGRELNKDQTSLAYAIANWKS